MKIEKLNNFKIKKVAIVLIVLLVIGATLILNGSFAKYRNTESINIAKGVIKYKMSDLNLVAMYQENDNGEYDKISRMPSSGYEINKEMSYCNVSGEKDTGAIMYTNKNDEHVISNIAENSKCYLYFDKIEAITMNEVIATKTKSTRTDFTTVYTADTTGTVFTAEDNDGTSYYYAGSPTDNYVKFAGFYWRIIRINGDGSIRMIYAGNVKTIDALDNKLDVLANGYNDSTTQYTQIKKGSFNANYNDNMYVGFMYTSGQLRGIGTSSTIKNILDTWYNYNLLDYVDKIDTNAGFCGDRTPSTSYTSINNSGGTGTTETYYGSHMRLYRQLYQDKQTSASPTFKCTNSKDLYTVEVSSKGNKALTNPIGLISAEEVAYAGGFYVTTNNIYYLYTGNKYWTISPNFFSGVGALMYHVESTGYLNQINVNDTSGVRPVINLQADTLFEPGGEGTIEKPYIVRGAE